MGKKSPSFDGLSFGVLALEGRIGLLIGVDCDEVKSFLLNEVFGFKSNFDSEGSFRYLTGSMSIQLVICAKLAWIVTVF